MLAAVQFIGLSSVKNRRAKVERIDSPADFMAQSSNRLGETECP
jgi:hypothetical protein